MKTISFSIWSFLLSNDQTDELRVEFESDSPDRNRLMKVVIKVDNLHLDVAELRLSHPRIYAEIKKMMIQESILEWSRDETFEEEIPTLAYQQSVVERLVDHIKKAAISIVFLLLVQSSFAQDTIYVAYPLVIQDSVIVAKKVTVLQALIAKDGHIVRTWHRKIRVHGGHIIRKANGLYMVNGRELKLIQDTSIAKK